MEEEIRGLRAFLDASHSHCHALAYLRDMLEGEGYVLLPERAEWELTPGGKYYAQRGGTALAAFRLPEEPAFRLPEEPAIGFLMSASPVSYTHLTLPTKA